MDRPHFLGKQDKYMYKHKTKQNSKLDIQPPVSRFHENTTCSYLKQNEKQKIPHGRNSSVSSRNIIDRGKIDSPSIQIQNHSLTCLL